MRQACSRQAWEGGGRACARATQSMAGEPISVSACAALPLLRGGRGSAQGGLPASAGLAGAAWRRQGGRSIPCAAVRWHRRAATPPGRDALAGQLHLQDGVGAVGADDGDHPQALARLQGRQRGWCRVDAGGARPSATSRRASKQCCASSTPHLRPQPLQAVHAAAVSLQADHGAAGAGHGGAHRQRDTRADGAACRGGRQCKWRGR